CMSRRALIAILRSSCPGRLLSSNPEVRPRDGLVTAGASAPARDRCADGFRKESRSTFVRFSSKRAAWLAAMGIALSHCVQPIDAPAAYSEHEYLCAPEHAAELEALVEQCREAYLRDQSCAGRVS